VGADHKAFRYPGWARFSADRSYRYLLGRELSMQQGDLFSGWQAPPGRGTLLFVMLNPSTASARKDDPTLRRCLGFARRWGFARLEVVNLFAWVASDPRDLKAATEPVGPRNNAMIRARARAADRVVCAWGAHGGHLGRDTEVLALLRRVRAPLFHLGLTREGHPRHPLYRPLDAAVEPWQPRLFHA